MLKKTGPASRINTILMKLAMAVGNNPSKIKINNVSVPIFGGGPSMVMAHKTTHTEEIRLLTLHGLYLVTCASK